MKDKPLAEVLKPVCRSSFTAFEFPGVFTSPDTLMLQEAIEAAKRMNNKRYMVFDFKILNEIKALFFLKIIFEIEA